MRIGIVDLDTSHPQNWIPILRRLGHDVVGVWDGGEVHPPSYPAQFAAAHGIPQVFTTLAEMADAVDCAIIHGCNWDTHVAKARPFVDAGKAVLLDKPLAGNVADLAQIAAWVNAGARIAGGSSLLFADEVREWLARPAAERGAPHTVFCGCAVDEFNYGIHAFGLLVAILSSDSAAQDAVSVRHLHSHVQELLQVTWADGRAGVLCVGAAAAWMPFYATIVTERAPHSLVISDAGKLYAALLTATLPYLARQTDTPPLPLDTWLLAERCALAARASKQRGGAAVALDDLPALLPHATDGYDGATFAQGYRAAKYPQGW